jgi:hypothetical protein
MKAKASPQIQELVSKSSLIFSGTVIALGASSVANLAPRNNFILARIDGPLKSDPALGNLRGKLVTVELLDTCEIQVPSRLIFFTQDWIHGGGIAAREVAHVGVESKKVVRAEVERLPERQLAERLADAVYIVLAEVVRIEPTPFDIRWRHSPQWATAPLKILKTLRGQPTQDITVLVPTVQWPIWARAPRLKARQRAIFLLRRPPDWTVPPESKDKFISAFTALNPEDVQPESRLALIEKLLSRGGSQ